MSTEKAQASPDNRKMVIEYVEHPLDHVVRYFVNGYKLNDGEIYSHEYFIDVAKNKAVLKLFVYKNEEAMPQTTNERDA